MAVFFWRSERFESVQTHAEVIQCRDVHTRVSLFDRSDAGTGETRVRGDASGVVNVKFQGLKQEAHSTPRSAAITVDAGFNNLVVV